MIKLSPNSLHLLKIVNSQLTEDFQSDSNVEILQIQQDQTLNSICEKKFTGSFSCCDWSFSNYIAAGTETGGLLLCLAEQLNDAEVSQIVQCEISSIAFSDESEGMLAIGTSLGEMLFYSVSGELIFQAQAKGQHPHASKVIQISWSPRVPRVCCSLDENGVSIVWDLKKRGAVMSFQSKGGASVLFSTVTTTVLYVLNNQAEVEIWDVRQKQEHQAVFKVRQGANLLRMQEGVENILGVFSPDGVVESYDLSTMKLVGSGNLGLQCSIVYPNFWVDIKEGQVKVHMRCVVINNRPILFNRKLLYSQLEETDEEVITLKHKPVSFSTKNIFRFMQGQQLMSQKVTDCEEVVVAAKAALGNEVKLQENLSTFFDNLSKSKQNLLEEVTGEQKVQKVNLKVDQISNENFFDEKQEEVDEELCGRIEKFLIVGDINSAINTLANEGNWGLAFYIQQKISGNQLELSTAYERANPIYKPIFDLLTLIQKKQFKDVNDWRKMLTLVRAYGGVVDTAIPDVIRQLEQGDAPELVPLLIYSGQQQRALELVLKKTGKLNIQERLSTAVQLNKFGLKYPQVQNLTTIVQVVEAQNQLELAQKLQAALGIKQVQQPVMQQPMAQFTQKATSKPVAMQPNTQMPLIPQVPIVHQPSQIPQMPFVPQVQPPQPSIPKFEPKNEVVSEKPSVLPFLPPPQNNFFNVGQIKQDEAPVQQVQQQVNQPMYAVDLFGAVNKQPEPNASQTPPIQQPQFQQDQHESNEPMQLPQALVMSSPIKPSMPPPPPMNVTQPSMIPHAFQARGPEIVAPPPPSLNSGEQNGMIKVTQTTAPRVITKPKPVQALNTIQRGMDMLNQIELKTELSQQLHRVAQKFQEKDQLSFNKNAQKLGELIIVAADCKQVPLLSAEAEECLNKVAQLFLAADYRGAQKALSDFGKQSDELNTWAGVLKMTAIALGK